MTHREALEPYDEHNRALEANVRPPDWANLTPIRIDALAESLLGVQPRNPAQMRQVSSCEASL